MSFLAPSKIAHNCKQKKKKKRKEEEGRIELILAPFQPPWANANEHEHE